MNLRTNSGERRASAAYAELDKLTDTFRPRYEAGVLSPKAARATQATAADIGTRYFGWQNGRPTPEALLRADRIAAKPSGTSEQLAAKVELTLAEIINDPTLQGLALESDPWNLLSPDLRTVPAIGWAAVAHFYPAVTTYLFLRHPIKTSRAARRTAREVKYDVHQIQKLAGYTKEDRQARRLRELEQRKIRKEARRKARSAPSG